MKTENSVSVTLEEKKMFYMFVWIRKTKHDSSHNLKKPFIKSRRTTESNIVNTSFMRYSNTFLSG